MKKTRYISVAGIIASGKTTAARILSEQLNFELIVENFAENVFLPKFYADMKRWAFHSQVFFLTEKVKQMITLKTLLEELSDPRLRKDDRKRGVVQDSPIEQDVFSYAQAQRILHNMDVAQWELYLSIYELQKDFLPKPDLVVYLEVSTENALMRIMTRGRKYEQEVTADYLDVLQRLNKEWLQKITVPVLRVDTNVLNIVSKKADEEELVEMVKERLT